jgi:hypothetical protein
VISEHPLLGAGLGQYGHVSKRFSFPVEDSVARYLKRTQIAHSEYLHYAAEIGIPGATLLIALLGYLFWLTWQRAPTCPPETRCFQETAILTGLGIGTHALFDNNWTIPVTCTALVVVAMADVLPLQKASSWTIRLGRKSIIAASTLIIGLIYVNGILLPAIGLYYNETGHRAFEENDLETAERYHRAAIAVIPDHPGFLDNLGMVYLQAFVETGKSQLADLAETHFSKAIAANPRSFEPRMHMEAILLRKLSGDVAMDRPLLEKVIETNRQLLEVDPFVPFVRKNLADALYHTGRHEEALAELTRAIEFEPNYVPGHLQLAQWYQAMGKTAESQRHTQIAIDIVTKYQDYKSKELYEAVLLGRPEKRPEGSDP